MGRPGANATGMAAAEHSERLLFPRVGRVGRGGLSPPRPPPPHARDLRRSSDGEVASMFPLLESWPAC